MCELCRTLVIPLDHGGSPSEQKMACQKRNSNCPRVDRHPGEFSKTQKPADIFRHRDRIWFTKGLLDHVVEFAKPFIDLDVDLDLHPEAPRMTNEPR